MKEVEQNLSKNKLVSILIQVFVVSVCSLTYELLLGTTISNLTGNPTLGYSLIIGLFLAGLGVGAYASRWVAEGNEVKTFIFVELFLGFFGGFSVLTVFYSFVFTRIFQVFYALLPFLIGLCSGYEIPLLTRIINKHANDELKTIISNILSFDYLGGLLASVAFPFILLPYFGLVQLSFLTGLINMMMAFLALYIFWGLLKNKTVLMITSGILAASLLISLFFSSQLYNFVESGFYFDPIIYSEQSQYQRIVVTRNGQDTRLYLNGGIQFSTTDEYRYHESLIIPAMSLLAQCEDCKHTIAIFGGGDGMAVREILKYEKNIDSIYLIDIDKAVTDLFQTNSFFSELNRNSLNNPLVKVLNFDAWEWLRDQPDFKFDLIISDLPDPQESQVARLYSQEFYTIIRNKLSQEGIFVTQATSPLNTPRAFWGIRTTLDSIFDEPTPYTVFIPSFGLWGFFALSKSGRFEYQKVYVDVETQYLSQENIQNIFQLDKDIQNPRMRNGELIDKTKLEVNTLNRLVLPSYYSLD